MTIKSKLFLLVLIFSSAFSVSVSQSSQNDEKISGFDSKSSQLERKIENIFQSVPSSKSSENHLRVLTEEPHMAGTTEDYATAIYVRDKMIEYGIPAEIVEYYAYLPYPKEIRIELVEPTYYQLQIGEIEIEGDKDSSDENLVMPFNAYSPSGNVKGELIYVNYGLKEDYQKLQEMGIDASGKIVLARYGKAYRGVKVTVAEENGAIGVILFSDPADDGYVKGDVFPKGPFKNQWAVQRGSIKNDAGDPLTPGWAATKNANRIKPGEADLPKIPCTPIGYGEAQKLLDALDGSVVSTDWQGGLPLTYHIGPGPAKVRMKLEMDFQIRPIWNVIAEVKGTQFPEQLVVLGQHRDSWGHGALDNTAGTVCLLEVTKGLGKLMQQGYQPKRTIVLASWDGEEFGLIGSTEWVEEHEEMLAKNCVAHLNLDVPVTGERFSASASPSLWKLMREVTQQMNLPNTETTIYANWRETQELKDDEEVNLGSLGGGSDYAGFFNHLGIASVGGFGFYGSGGVYHSGYDDFYWMSRFGDPGFKYHPIVAALWGTIALRLANAQVLLLDYAEYGSELAKYIESVEEKLKDSGENFNLVPLKARAKEFSRLGEGVNAMREFILSQPSSFVEGNRETTKIINKKLMLIERALTREDGLAGRPWYRNLVYAPGLYTGYGTQTLPGINEAITIEDWDSVRNEIKDFEGALDRAIHILKEQQ